MDRSNHYEKSFEAYLLHHKICHVGVDEQRRSALGGQPVKSLDFILYCDQGARFVVDIKGRKFPSGPSDKPRRVWERWATQEDIEGLDLWAEMSGPGYQGLLVFLYDLDDSVALPEDTEDLWSFQGKRYLVRALRCADYRKHLKIRSPSWGTVDIPNSAFKELVRPLRHFTHGAPEQPDFDDPWWES
ncbi:MAG: hypothetical protein EXR99_10125 [Gemmataceae bacterium]|nr:hypothetical protein [Gemmataceae bacterium]